MWCIPPAQNGQFVARMERLLDVYCWPYDPRRPVVCMDEQPVRLIAESRAPIAVGVSIVVTSKLVEAVTLMIIGYRPLWPCQGASLRDSSWTGSPLPVAGHHEDERLSAASVESWLNRSMQL